MYSIDPFYLTWKARKYDCATRFIELAGEVNIAMPYYVVQKVTDAINKSGKSITGAKVLVLGAAYKKDVDDIRESPAVKIITLLLDKGADVSYHDPYIPVIRGMRKYPELVMESVELTEGNLVAADCMLLITNHSRFDYGWILEKSARIVDTRNAFGGFGSEKVIKALGHNYG